MTKIVYMEHTIRNTIKFSTRNSTLKEGTTLWHDQINVSHVLVVQSYRWHLQLMQDVNSIREESEK